jgi:hypothetical protein
MMGQTGILLSSIILTLRPQTKIGLGEELELEGFDE